VGFPESRETLYRDVVIARVISFLRMREEFSYILRMRDINAPNLREDRPCERSGDVWRSLLRTIIV